MAGQGNFKKAMDELLGGTAAPEDEDTTNESYSSYEEEEGMAEEMDTMTKAAVPNYNLNMSEMPVDTATQELARTSPSEFGRAVITADTTITGDIDVTSDMLILGTIVGNIHSTANVVIRGNLNGDIAAKSVTMIGGGITGKVEVTDTVSLDKDSMIQGDIQAIVYTSAGKTEGNVIAKEAAQFFETARLIGNITCGNLSVMAGARIKGMMEVLIAEGE